MQEQFGDKGIHRFMAEMPFDLNKRLENYIQNASIKESKKGVINRALIKELDLLETNPNPTDQK